MPIPVTLWPFVLPLDPSFIDTEFWVLVQIIGDGWRYRENLDCYLLLLCLKISIAGVERSHLLFSGFGNWGSKTF